MSGADCCGKALLVIINLFFSALGLLLLAAGLFLVFGQSMLMSLVEQPLDEAGIQSSVYEKGNVFYVINIAAYVLIGLGAFTFIVGICGCSGACCSVKALLILYIVIVAVLFIVEVVVLSLWLSKAFDKEIRSSLTSDLKNSYEGPYGNKVESFFLNFLMVSLDCCGINNYMDFNETKNWNRTVVTTDNDGTKEVVTEIVPKTCCRSSGSYPKDLEPYDSRCTVEPTTSNSFMTQGCYEKIEDIIEERKAVIIGIYSAILLFEAICIAIAVCLLIRIKQYSDSNSLVYPYKY